LVDFQLLPVSRIKRRGTQTTTHGAACFFQRSDPLSIEELFHVDAQPIEIMMDLIGPEALHPSDGIKVINAYDIRIDFVQLYD
jgi:hypothetical protein